MTLFLTSHIGGFAEGSFEQLPGPLLTDNGLVEQLKSRWKANSNVLFVAYDPEDTASCQRNKAAFTYAFPLHGMSIGSYSICDISNMNAANDLSPYDVVILSSGHVPTQNRFFSQIGLKEKIRDFPGIVIGISAGSMNCAESVYSCPELSGEALDPEYIRFIPGLGLTRLNVIPHYQWIRNVELDGFAMEQDIFLPDSYGNCFLAIDDGSYIICEDGVQTLHGRGYLLEDGIIKQICDSNRAVTIPSSKA